MIVLNKTVTIKPPVCWIGIVFAVFYIKIHFLGKAIVKITKVQKSLKKVLTKVVRSGKIDELSARRRVLIKKLKKT